jgi:hypothetical protein
MSNTQEAPQIADGVHYVHDVASLAAAVRMSKQYVRDDIRDGYLTAGDLNGRKFLIEIPEAERYAKWLASGRPAS